MSKHISKLQAPLTMDSTIGAFRKKFREDKEFQEHCILQHSGERKDKQNVDFVMAILLGGISTHAKTHPEAKIYCAEVHGQPGNWASSVSTKLDKITSKDFKEAINELYKQTLNKKTAPTKTEIESITLQRLVKQITGSKNPVGRQGKASKPIYNHPKLINSAADVNDLNNTLNILLAPTAMEKAADLISRGEARQIIFTGAPGTGKTYVAKELAKHFLAVGDAGTLPAKNGEEHPYVQVQFHPSYDYTDFVEGLRPIELDSAAASNSIFFGKVDGQFKQFCRAVVEKNAEYTHRKEDEAKELAAQLLCTLTGRAAEVDALSQMLQQVEELLPDSTSFDAMFHQISKKQALEYLQELDGLIRSASDNEPESDDEEPLPNLTDDSESRDEESAADSNPDSLPDDDASEEDEELAAIWKAFDELINHKNLNDDHKKKIEASRDVMFASKNQLNELTQKTIENLLNQMTCGKGTWFTDRTRIPRGTSDYINPIKEFLIARMDQQLSPEEHRRHAEILLLASRQEQAEKLYRSICDGAGKDSARTLFARCRSALLNKVKEALIPQLQRLLDNDTIPSDRDLSKLTWLKTSVPKSAKAYEALNTLEIRIVECQGKQEDENPPSPKGLLPSLASVEKLQESDFDPLAAVDCKLDVEKICLDHERLDYPLYFFIIDEINRANLSKVFGELMYCLEKGKRGKKNAIKTQYQNLDTYDISGAKLKELPADPKKPGGAKKADVFEDNFYIPKNVVVLGTMNDIDRSVDSMDFALRRRFEWIEFKVTKETLMRAFEARNFGKGINTYAAELAAAIMELNEYMTQADGLRYGLTTQHYISHGYFADLPAYLLNGDMTTAATFLPPIKTYVWTYRVEPLLREYLRGYSSTEIDKFIRAAEKKWLQDA